MSLIDEALKRARAEADRQQVAQRTPTSRWVPSYPLARRRPRLLLWAGAAVVCLAAGVAVGLGVSALSDDDRPGEREREARRAPAVTEAPQGLSYDDQAGTRPPALLFDELETSEAPGAGLDILGPAAGPPEITEPGSPIQVQVGEQGVVLSRRESPGGATRPGVVPPREEAASPSPGPSSAGAAPTDSQAAAPSPPAPGAPPAPRPAASTHVRRADLPGGGAIELGGIAFSTNPVALLNGRVVGVGEVVEGMKVVAISPGRVDLEGRGTTIALLIE